MDRRELRESPRASPERVRPLRRPPAGQARLRPASRTNSGAAKENQFPLPGGLATVHRVPLDQLPRRVRELEHIWIPLADGCRLAARIWLPEDADGDPVPAVLEYLPYRKNDGTAARDAVRQPYLAGHGYAAVRVDARGTGESDGII